MADAGAGPSAPAASTPLTPPPLRVLTLHLAFQAETPLLLPRWKGALLRGGLGRALRAALCDPACARDGACPRGGACPYRTVFAPEAEEGRSDLQGLRDAPRPYAVRPPLDEQTAYPPGARLDFGLVLIGTAIQYLPHILFAFETLGTMGLGSGRGRAKLAAVSSVDPLGERILPLLADGTLHNQVQTRSGAEVVAAAAGLPALLTLRFPTPMRLKHNGQMATIPECHVLVRAALRRISQLCAFFGEGPWEVPFGDLIRRAEGVRLRECRTHWVDWSRTSGGTGQHMTLGGFVGSAVYEEVPPAIRAILLAGSLVHIGKAVVFGHGYYQVTGGSGRP